MGKELSTSKAARISYVDIDDKKITFVNPSLSTEDRNNKNTDGNGFVGILDGVRWDKELGEERTERKGQGKHTFNDYKENISSNVDCDWDKYPIEVKEDVFAIKKAANDNRIAKPYRPELKRQGYQIIRKKSDKRTVSDFFIDTDGTQKQFVKQKDFIYLRSNRKDAVLFARISKGKCNVVSGHEVTNTRKKMLRQIL